MGEAPNDTIVAPHYGSLYTDADYVSDNHNVYFSASFLPTPKLRATGTVVYNKATAAYDQINMPEPGELVEAELEHMDYDLDQVHEYSDLDYAMIKLSLGIEYEISPLWRFTLSGDYANLEDNTGYVYGVETGSYYVIRSGARFTF